MYIRTQTNDDDHDHDHCRARCKASSERAQPCGPRDVFGEKEPCSSSPTRVACNQEPDTVPSIAAVCAIPRSLQARVCCIGQDVLEIFSSPDIIRIPSLLHPPTLAPLPVARDCHVPAHDNSRHGSAQLTMS
jgi:hypothetical protein